MIFILVFSDDEKTWNDLESEFLMIDDSVRLNEAGVIKTRGAHHPLKLDPKEAILRPDMHAYAPFSTLLPHGAMQVREENHLRITTQKLHSNAQIDIH